MRMEEAAMIQAIISMALSSWHSDIPPLTGPTPPHSTYSRVLCTSTPPTIQNTVLRNKKICEREYHALEPLVGPPRAHVYRGEHYASHRGKEEEGDALTFLFRSPHMFALEVLERVDGEPEFENGEDE